MTVESVTYISDLNQSNPAGTDPKSEGDDHIRNIKKGIDGSFPNFAGIAMTSTEAELNILDGCTATTAELNIIDGVTATTAELNYVDGVTSDIQTQLDAKMTGSSNLSDVDNASTSRTNLGLGSLSTLSQLSSPDELPDYTAGGFLVHSVDTVRTATTTSPQKIKEITVAKGGTLTVKFDLAHTSGGQTAYGQIYVNGSPSGTLRSVAGTAYSTFSESIAVSTGDLLQLYSYTPSTTANVKNFRIYKDDNEPSTTHDANY